MVAKYWPILHLAIPFVVIATSAMIGGSSDVDTRADSFKQAQSVEQYVREYFEDTPILAEIAACETHFRHYDKSGNVIRGDINSSDLGVMQINEYYHGDTADRMGYDIYTLQGNLEYARNLYERKGAQPWVSSSHCWKDSQHIAQK